MSIKNQSVYPESKKKIDLNDLIIDSIRDIKGKQIVKFDLRDLDDAPTDYYVICEGESNIQVKAISENIHNRVKQETGITPSHIEGTTHARWILVDYFTTVVHIFYPETRSFYDLDEMWGDAKITFYESY